MKGSLLIKHLGCAPHLLAVWACLALASLSAPARADIIDYTYTFASDIESLGEFDDPSNVIVDIDLTSLGLLPDLEIIGAAYDVDLVATSPSWLSELVVSFNDEVFLTPGFDDDAPGGPVNYSEGMLIFEDIGIDNIVITNGILSLRFFEWFDDASVDPDGLWLAGSSLTFRLNATPVPEPASLAMIVCGLVGVGGYGFARRARRGSAA
jgi:hypothetical protein